MESMDKSQVHLIRVRKLKRMRRLHWDMLVRESINSHYQIGKCGYPLGEYPKFGTTMYLLHKGYIGQKGEYLGNKLTGYSFKGTHIFCLTLCPCNRG